MPLTNSSINDKIQSEEIQIIEPNGLNGKCNNNNKEGTNRNIEPSTYSDKRGESRQLIIELNDINNSSAANTSGKKELSNKNKVGYKENGDAVKCSGEQNVDMIESDGDVELVEGDGVTPILFQLTEGNVSSVVIDKNKSQNKINIFKKQNKKYNLSRELSQINNEIRHEEKDEIIELDTCDDMENTNLEVDIIEINDEGTEFLDSVGSNHSEDDGVIVLYDRKQDSDNNQVVIDLDDQDISVEDKNPINTLTTNFQKHFKTQRLSEDISEEERQILQATFFCFKDNMFKDVCSCVKVDQKWFYFCHPCNVKNLLLSTFLQHIHGVKHRKQGLKLPVQIASTTGKNNTGDPDFSKKSWTIYENLNSITKPVIGLEYLLECVISVGQPPRLQVYNHYCALCDTTKSNFTSLMAHLTSSQHYQTYLTKFFPTVSMKIQSNVGCKSELIRLKFLEHVIGRIEYIHGRLQPSQITLKTFKEKKNFLREKIDENPVHFWETPEDTFEDCVDETHFDSTQCVVGWTHSPRNSPLVEKPQPVFSLSTDFGGYNVTRSTSEMDSKAAIPRTYNHPNSKLSSQIVTSIKPFLHSQNVPDMTSSRDVNFLERFDEEDKVFYEKLSSHDPSLWEKYMQRIERIESDIKRDIVYYCENPEKHVRYQVEYTKFCIQQGGFKSEIMSLWKTFLTEIYRTVFKNEKFKIRKEFLDNYCCSKDMRQHQNQLLHNPSLQQRTDTNNLHQALNGRPYKRQYRSLNHVINTYKRSKLNSELTSTITKKAEDKPNIISVLRYISVLENSLGSLGIKVINLLSNALSIDKSKDATNVLLSRQENCILLCTVKEKLIGLLEAKILEKALISVAENATIKISTLLSDHESSSNSDETRFGMPLCLDVPPNDCLKLRDISNFIKTFDKLSHLRNVEKAALAQRIGSVLFIQNKYEISNKDLVALIYKTGKELKLPLNENNSLICDRFLGNNNVYKKSENYSSDRNISYRSQNSTVTHSTDQSPLSNTSRNQQNFQPISNYFSRQNSAPPFNVSNSYTGSYTPQYVVQPTHFNKATSTYNPGHVSNFGPPSSTNRHPFKHTHQSRGFRKFSNP